MEGIHCRKDCPGDVPGTDSTHYDEEKGSVEMRIEQSQKMRVSLWIPLGGTVYADYNQTRFWRANVTGHEIVYGNIREGISNYWDEVIDHYDSTTTFLPSPRSFLKARTP